MSLYLVRSTPATMCTDCEHASLGPAGVHCRIFDEDVVYEAVAQECGSFDPLPSAPTLEGQRDE